MANEIAVEGMTLAFITTGLAGSISISGSPSLKSKCSGSAVYSNGLTIACSSMTYSGGFVFAGPVTVTMQATATKSKDSSSLVLRVNDTSTSVPTTFTNPTSGATTLVPVQVKITNAGQTKVHSL